MSLELPRELLTIGPAELASILKKSEATIRRDAARCPEKLPPRIHTGGQKNRLVWRLVTVEAWLERQEGGPL